MTTETVAPTPNPPEPKGTTKRRFVIPERFFTLQSYVALALVFLLSVAISPRRGLTASTIKRTTARGV